ncbi:thiaminase II [Oscillospiraceae bacterium 38-13]
MKTTERLLSAVKEIWDAYNEHPFVLGIQDGTLDQEKFKYYIIQDFLYLEEYAKVFALGIAKAKSPETTALFSKYVALLTEGEMDIHRGYMGKFAVSRKELEATHRALDNLSYTSYMLRVAYEEGEAEILAAILSCAYSYEVIARKIVERNPGALDHPFYGDWVKGYANPQYSEANVLLLETTDRLTQHYTEQQVRHLVNIFISCSRYELAFWELAWNMDK